MTYVNGFTLPAPNPTAFFQRAINALWHCGVDMLGRIKGVPKGGNADHLPRRWRDPDHAEQRLIRTLDWILALARTLAGSSTYLLPQKRQPAAKPRKPAKPRTRPAPPSPEHLTEEQRAELEQDRETNRDVARVRYMKKIFATQATNRIAKRLARRLGAKEGTDWWPEELLAITETPVAWAARTFRQPSETPRLHPEPEPSPPEPEAPGIQAEVPFHRRE
jgi:hypothetical protein